MFENMIAKLKQNKKKIVFTEGTDPRVLAAATRLYHEGILNPLLLGNPDAVHAVAKEKGFIIDGIEMIDPANYSDMDTLASEMAELRKVS